MVIRPPLGSSDPRPARRRRGVGAPLALLLLVAVAVGACGDDDATDGAPSAAEAGVSVVDPVMPVPAGPMGAAYMTIENTGTEVDTLLGARTDDGDRAMVHRTEIAEDGQVTMDEAGDLEVPAGGELALAPGGLHLMVAVPDGLEVGDVVELVLDFADAGEIGIDVEVVDPGEVSR
ncbi:copper chaperone PCu(A)C [Rhabdothermincola salaria]|uniref:copper chaperone PCu(A)C n=1 Tax=Rhabdothermincola salaria TaxID=2903142 RepID=UPI001E42EEF4|nr:copper chaperone PCu(A)C [Rhabdothermincola salaria]